MDINDCIDSKVNPLLEADDYKAVYGILKGLEKKTWDIYKKVRLSELIAVLTIKFPGLYDSLQKSIGQYVEVKRPDSAIPYKMYVSRIQFEECTYGGYLDIIGYVEDWDKYDMLRIFEKNFDCVEITVKKCSDSKLCQFREKYPPEQEITLSTDCIHPYRECLGE